MEPRWTYARTRTAKGTFSPYDLTVLLNGQPVGWVRYSSSADKSCWQWRVNLTQDHGHCDEKMDALNALRDSLTTDLQQPF